MEEITVKINKSEKDEDEKFTVMITGSCEGEPYDWSLPDLYTDEEWAAVERYKIAEYKRMVLTQFE